VWCSELVFATISVTTQTYPAVWKDRPKTLVDISPKKFPGKRAIRKDQVVLEPADGDGLHPISVQFWGSAASNARSPSGHDKKDVVWWTSVLNRRNFSLIVSDDRQMWSSRLYKLALKKRNFVAIWMPDLLS